MPIHASISLRTRPMCYATLYGHEMDAGASKPRRGRLSTHDFVKGSFATDRTRSTALAGLTIEQMQYLEPSAACMPRPRRSLALSGKCNFLHTIQIDQLLSPPNSLQSPASTE
jgi:hypothetical protein